MNEIVLQIQILASMPNKSGKCRKIVIVMTHRIFLTVTDDRTTILIRPIAIIRLNIFSKLILRIGACNIINEDINLAKAIKRFHLTN